MKLKVKTIEGLKSGKNNYRVADGHGLALLVHKNGSKYWRHRYRRPGSGVAAELAIGVYPHTSLDEARKKSYEARLLLDKGIDPGRMKEALRLSNVLESGFMAIAEEWLIKQEKVWSPEHTKRNRERLKRYVYPWLADVPISELKPPLILAVIGQIEKKDKFETAHRIFSLISRICRYAVATGRSDSDPTAALSGALTPRSSQHFGAITEPETFAGLLRAIDSFDGHITTCCALKLAPLVFVRPGELRMAKWLEIDLETAEWRLVTKGGRLHIVPLSRQALAIFQELHPITAHRSQYVFPGIRSAKRPMSDAALTAALRRMGYSGDQATVHGFRATARTLLDEVLGFRPDFIEHQLAHAVRDPNGRAYNRTEFLVQRREMLQAWADYLDDLKTGKEKSKAQMKNSLGAHGVVEGIGISYSVLFDMEPTGNLSWGVSSRDLN